MHFFIYGRKSVYTGKGESIENQLEMCKQYIQNKFSDQSEQDITVYEDEGFSAKNTDRPQFQQMLRDMKRQKPDYLVCYRLDRISRNVSDFSALIEELNDRNISFVCIKEEFDTSKPMGKAMMYIASVFAQLERETIAERVRDNMLMLARTGRWLGGTTPLGYTSEKMQEVVIDGRMKTSWRLREQPEELRIVDLIFEKYLELHSISGVSKYLAGQGIRSRKGKSYSLEGIKQILQNPVYCAADQDAFDYFTACHSDVSFEAGECTGKYGLLSYNKRDYKKKHAPRQPVSQWIIAIGKHRGRIPGRKWAAVQNALKEIMPAEGGPAPVKNDYSLLSGMIRCSQCGSRMFAKRRTGREANRRVYDYICGSKIQGGRKACSCQNISGRQADDAVCRFLREYASEDGGLCRMLERLKDRLQKQLQRQPQSQPQGNRPGSIAAQIDRCRAEMNQLMNSLAEGQLCSAFIRQVNGRIGELDQKLSRLLQERQRQEAVRLPDDREEASGILSGGHYALKDQIAVLSVRDKRQLLRLMAEKVLWDGERLHIYMR